MRVRVCARSRLRCITPRARRHTRTSVSRNRRGLAGGGGEASFSFITWFTYSALVSPALHTPSLNCLPRLAPSALFCYLHHCIIFPSVFVFYFHSLFSLSLTLSLFLSLFVLFRSRSPVFSALSLSRSPFSFSLSISPRFRFAVSSCFVLSYLDFHSFLLWCRRAAVAHRRVSFVCCRVRFAQLLHLNLPILIYSLLLL